MDGHAAAVRTKLSSKPAALTSAYDGNTGEKQNDEYDSENKEEGEEDLRNAGGAPRYAGIA
jgi:hypothetical protein